MTVTTRRAPLTPPTSPTLQASRARSRHKKHQLPTALLTPKIVLAVVIAVPLMLAPLSPMISMPWGLGHGDHGLLLGTVLGAALGAGVYWSLPKRRTSRRHRVEWKRWLFTFGASCTGGAILAVTSLYITDDAIPAAELGGALLYAVWCAVVLGTAYLLGRDQQHRTVFSPARTANVVPHAPFTGPIIEFSVAPPHPVTAPAALPATLRAERECPWCAEMILAKARLCKHCNRELEPQI